MYSDSYTNWSVYTDKNPVSVSCAFTMDGCLKIENQKLYIKFLVFVCFRTTICIVERIKNYAK